MNNETDEKRLDKTDVIAYYTNKLKRFGLTHQTVGWGSKTSQELRFEVLLRNLDLENKTILDVGCGLGDLAAFIHSRAIKNFSYIGIELVPDFIEISQQRFKDNANIRFIRHDMEKLSDLVLNVDIVLISGALSLKIGDNWNLMKKTVNDAFKLCKECLTVNFLTSYADFYLDKDYHFQPEKVFAFAKSLSPKVNLIHDYPLYEFTIQIFK